MEPQEPDFLLLLNAGIKHRSQHNTHLSHTHSGYRTLVLNLVEQACYPLNGLPATVISFSQLHLNLQTEASTGAQVAAGLFTCARFEQVKEPVSASVSSSGFIHCKKTVESRDHMHGPGIAQSHE